MITISDAELSVILCALRESAASATEYAYMAPEGTPERAVLLANADAFAGLTTRLMARESAHADRRYQPAACAAQFVGLVAEPCA